MLELVCRECGHVIFQSNDILKFMDIRETIGKCPKCQRVLPRNVKEDKIFLNEKEMGVVG